MKGLILVNAYMDNPAASYQADRLKEELLALGVAADIRRNDFFCARIYGGDIQNAVTGYDFCIFCDKDKYASAALEKAGLRLFDTHSAIRLCDDKFETFLALSGKGIPMPKTIAGLLCYGGGEISDKNMDFLVGELGLPMIVKESYGSLGKGVYKADDRQQLKNIAQKLICTPHLFQKFIFESAGRDIRVIVTGGRVVAAMERVSDTDFRSNIGLGGKGRAYAPDGKLCGLCVKTAEILGADYCGIDVLEGRDGYLVCEVNSNAFFGGMERATGINVARAYAEHIVNCINSKNQHLY